MIKSNLRLLMVKHNIKDRADLMKLCNLSRNTIDKVYHSKNLENIPLGTFDALCDVFNCDIGDLITRDKTNNSDIQEPTIL